MKNGTLPQKRKKKKKVKKEESNSNSNRVSHYQSAFNSQKEKLYIYWQKCSKSQKVGAVDLFVHTITIRAPVRANKTLDKDETVWSILVIFSN